MLKLLRGWYEAVVSWAVGGIAGTGIHPNVLTVASVFPALAAGVAAAFGSFLGAALLLLLSGVFDILDGALARATGKTSRFGAILDSSLDRLSDAAVPAGLAVFYAPFDKVVIIPVLTIVSGFLVSYIRARAEGLSIELPRLWMRREDRMVLLVIGLLLQPLIVPGLALPGGLTLVTLALLTVLSFVAGGMALAAAARLA